VVEVKIGKSDKHRWRRPACALVVAREQLGRARTLFLAFLIVALTNLNSMIRRQDEWV